MKPNFQKETFAARRFRDGTFVAYFFDETDNRLKIGVMLVETRTLSRIFALPENTYYRGSIAWKNDDKSFYYVTINGSQNSLWLQSLDNNNPPQLVGNLGSDEIPHFALSPDKNSFAFIRGRFFHEAVLIEGLK